ncbi:hypothetical protein Tco_0536716 [Tanacetum coccineum]
MDVQGDGFTEVSNRKIKGKKVDINQPKTRHVSGIQITKSKPSFYRPVTKHATNMSGVDPKVQGADSSYKKINGTSTSNSFDVLNNVDVGDECGISSSMGIQKEDQKAGHATTSKHNSSRWDEDFESDDEVDEVLFPEGDKFGDQFDIRLKGRSRK